VPLTLTIDQRAIIRLTDASRTPKGVPTSIGSGTCSRQRPSGTFHAVTGIEGDDDIETRDQPDAYEALDTTFGSAVRDPYPALAEQRRRCPVHRGTLFDVVASADPATALDLGDDAPYAVLGYDVTGAAFRDDAGYSSGPPSAPLFYEMMGLTMIQMDAPEHRRYRGLVSQAFTRKAVQTWETELVRPIAAGLVDAFADRGRADLVRELTLLFPTAVIGTMLGLPEHELPWLHEKGAEILRWDDLDIARRASTAMGDRFRDLVEARRHEPGDDVTGLLVRAMLEPDDAVWGDRVLSTDEIVSAMKQIFRAGVDTTYRAMSNMLFGLLSHPEQLAAVRDDRTLIPQAIEESLRWEPPLLMMGRYTTRAVMVDTQEIPAQSVVTLCIGAANRDERRFDRPDDFDIFRTPHPHLAFGVGPHVCLGIHLARLEMRVALEAVLDRLPGIRLDPGAAGVHIRGVTHRSPGALPVVFDALRP
jgi:cytochrome P450